MNKKQPEYLDIKSFAAYLNVSSEIIKNWIKNRVLSRTSYFEIHGLTRIKLSNALKDLHDFSSEESIAEKTGDLKKNAEIPSIVEQQRPKIEEERSKERETTTNFKELKNKKNDVRKINIKAYELARAEEDFVDVDGLDFSEGLDFEDTSILEVAEAVAEYQYEKDYTDRPVKVGDDVFVCFYDDAIENFRDEEKFTLVKSDKVKRGQISISSPFGKTLLNAVPMECYKFEENKKIREFLLLAVE